MDECTSVKLYDARYVGLLVIIMCLNF